jgi:hypothetical protein
MQYFPDPEFFAYRFRLFDNGQQKKAIVALRPSRLYNHRVDSLILYHLRNQVNYLGLKDSSDDLKYASV